MFFNQQSIVVESMSESQLNDQDCCYTPVEVYRAMKVWEITYKGHQIRVEHSLFRGERLIVDGEVQDAPLGAVLRSCLEGRIKSATGCGERVKVYLGGTFFMGCNIVIDHSLVYCSGDRKTHPSEVCSRHG